MNWQDYFYYDESSPSCLRWKVNVYAGADYQVLKVAAGDVAGSLSKRDGYWRVWLHGKSYLVHRVIMALVHGESEKTVDHADGMRHNNKVGNLRYIDGELNPRNAKKYASNSSGKAGVKKTETHGGRYSNWTAYAENPFGDRLTKSYSIAKHGNDEAYRLACAKRDEFIEQLNSQGAGYTERHGTEELEF